MEDDFYLAKPTVGKGSIASQGLSPANNCAWIRCDPRTGWNERPAPMNDAGSWESHFRPAILRALHTCCKLIY